MSITTEQMLERIDSMTIIELNEFVKTIEEKTEFTVVLKEAPPEKKISVIKEVRAITGLGLKEAKDLVEGAPKEVVKDVTKDEATKVQKQLEAAGGIVEMK